MHADYARSYADLWTNHWWWQARAALVQRTLAQFLTPHPHPDQIRNILEVGCGAGWFFPALAQFGDVAGIEPDPTLIRQAPQTAQRAITQARFEPQALQNHPALAAQRFDAIILLDVLEHLPDETEALTLLAHLLKPGGAALITVPALMSLWSRHDEINAHRTRYRRSTLRDALTNAGLSVEIVRYHYFWTVLPLFARRLRHPARSPGPREQQPNDYAVKIPPRRLNAALRALSHCDHALGERLRWPWGSSLLAVARRPAL